MGSGGDGRDGAAAWDVARPARPGRVAGVGMAGFRSRKTDPIELRVVPHPSVTLVVEFGDGPLVVDDATGRRQLGGLVAGLAPSAVRMRGQNIQCIEVRLSPVVAHAALGARPGELDRAVVALDDVLALDAERVREQLADAASWDDRFALTEALFARRVASCPPADPEVAWAWERIVASGGGVRVEDLAVEVGWSRKRLWTRFRSQVGLPPKRAARLVRFHHAANRLAAGDSAALVAAECGYVDQSHLHRDVQAFSGVTPVTLAGDPGFAADHVGFAS
jgi:AraC-like DNA-binding protein